MKPKELSKGELTDINEEDSYDKKGVPEEVTW